MANFSAYIKEVKSQIKEIDLEGMKKASLAAKEKNAAGPVLIDVRERDEWLQGHIPGATWIPRGFLELKIEDQVSRETKRWCCTVPAATARPWPPNHCKTLGIPTWSPWLVVSPLGSKAATHLTSLWC